MNLGRYINDERKYLSFGSFIKTNLLISGINLIGWIVWIAFTIATGNWGMSLVIAAIVMLLLNLAAVYMKRWDPFFNRTIGWNMFNFSKTFWTVLGIGVLCILLFAAYISVAPR